MNPVKPTNNAAFRKGEEKIVAEKGDDDNDDTWWWRGWELLKQYYSSTHMYLV